MKNIFKNDAFVVAVLSAIIFYSFLGVRTLSVPDEGRYVSIALEMLRTGDWIVPRLNGVQYLYKPPMFYWLNAFALMLVDNVEIASRLVPSFVGWMTVIFTFLTAKKFYGRSVAYYSAFFLSLSFIWYIGSRSVNLDLTVAGFTAWALFAYIWGFNETDKTRRNVYLYGMYIVSALAVLTKGFMGIVIPGAVFFLHILFTNSWKELLRLNIPTGIVLFLAIIMPWHVLMHMANPEWFDFYIIREHFLRFFTKVHARYEPMWYFIPIMALGVMPFGAFVLQPLLRIRSYWKSRKKDSAVDLYLWIWFVFIFVFFSVSSSKLPLYVLPILPALAIMVGRFMVEFAQGKHIGCVKISSIVYMIFTGAIGGALLIFQAFPELVPATENATLADDIVAMGIPLWLFAFGLFSHSFISVLSIFMGKRMVAIVLAGALFIPSLFSLNYVIQLVNEKSTYDVVQTIKQHRKGNEEIVTTLFVEDLPAYLNENISVINYSGESAYFLHYDDISDRYYNRSEFLRRWNSDSRMFLIIYNGWYKESVDGVVGTVIFKNKRYSVMMNK